MIYHYIFGYFLMSVIICCVTIRVSVFLCFCSGIIMIFAAYSKFLNLVSVFTIRPDLVWSGLCQFWPLSSIKLVMLKLAVLFLSLFSLNHSMVCAVFGIGMAHRWIWLWRSFLQFGVSMT